MNSPSEEVVTIARRFRGPPESANGGYACGIVGRRIDGDARVRLHRPPPLDTPMTLGPLDRNFLAMRLADTLIAEGQPSAVPAAPPAAVSFDVATAAARNYRWFDGHPFPGCFVCGPDRHVHDGLCIFTGPVPDRKIVAAPWVPDASVCDTNGLVETEIIWAVLDCPSWFALLEFEPGAGMALLGQLSARVLRRPADGERCVVTGWPRGRDNRKLSAGAALFTADGELLGHSDATWIELKQAS